MHGVSASASACIVYLAYICFFQLRTYTCTHIRDGACMHSSLLASLRSLDVYMIEFASRGDDETEVIISISCLMIRGQKYERGRHDRARHRTSGPAAQAVYHARERSSYMLLSIHMGTFRRPFITHGQHIYMLDALDVAEACIWPDVGMYVRPGKGAARRSSCFPASMMPTGFPLCARRSSELRILA